MKGTDANKSKRIKPDKMAKTARKKKVTKAKRGIEEFYRKKKVGDKLKYALYPVWILNTTWNGEKFTFAMNGQSGKLVGNLPMDKKKFWIGVSVRGGIIGLVIYLLLWIIALM